MSKIKKILIALSILLLVLSLGNIAESLLKDYYRQRKIKELKRLTENLKIESNINDGIEATEAKGVMLPELQELHKRNSDIIGWLKVSNTRIDYPVMQNPEDAEYYLYRDFDKKEDKNGLPFLDVHCHIGDSDILLIHGHHMKDGSMFAGLMEYKEESFYQEHSTFQFSTPYEKSEYEIVAVILSKVYSKSEDVFKYYQIEEVDTATEFNQYMQNIKKLAIYDTGVTAQYGDKLIILSACEYSTENGRLAVIARKKSIIQN